MPGLKLMDANTLDAFTGPVHNVADYGSEPLRAVFVFSSDFNTGTLIIEISPDNAEWFPARTRNDNQAKFTVSDHMFIVVPAPFLRARFEGGAGAVQALTVIMI